MIMIPTFACTQGFLQLRITPRFSQSFYNGWNRLLPGTREDPSAYVAFLYDTQVVGMLLC